MAKLLWDQAGEKLFETGVKQGVLYPQVNGAYPKGIAWNGLSSVSESPSGAEASPIYADDTKYLNLVSAEEFGATIEAYMYPDEFAECDGSAEIASGVSVGQQTRKTFGFVYKTTLGNDTENNEYGYKLHLIYNCLAAPSEKSYSTINDSPEAITFSWELSTTPVTLAGFKPTANITIDSTKADPAKLAQLEDILFGTAATDARLPLPDEVQSIMGTTAAYSVVNYLTNVVTDNDARIATTNYTANLTAAAGYTIANVIVTMGGADITSTAYDAGTVTIASVTGPIVVMATANAG